VAERLRERRPGLEVRLEVIRTTGDKILDVPLARVGGKALFVKEIEEALLAGQVDLAVHSMKDVPTELPGGLAIAAIPPREAAEDVLLSRTGERFLDLRRGARVGTSSLRRQAQLLHHRPDLCVIPLRGNLDTRIRKLESEGLDAIVLAAAGVLRLGLRHRITEILDRAVCVPAVGQGALGIEVRAPGGERRGGRRAAGDRDPGSPTPEPEAANREPASADRDRGIGELIGGLDHRETRLAIGAERALLRGLGGGCQVPIAGHARVEGSLATLTGLVATPDGRTVIRAERRGPAAEAEALGAALAEDLLSRGAAEILAALYDARSG
jgi:hydroxymethylbilane synthase